MCWQYLCPSWTPPQQTDIQSIMDSLKISLKETFFMELIMLTADLYELQEMISSSKKFPQAYTDAGKSLRMSYLSFA
jgi:ABC-type anion transport system duplicated permease subunit